MCEVYMSYISPIKYKCKLKVDKYMSEISPNQILGIKEDKVDQTNNSFISIYLSRAMRKRVLCHIRTTKAQIRSAPLLFAA